MSSKDNQSEKATSVSRDQSDMSCLNNLLSALQDISPTTTSTLFSSSIVTSGTASTNETTTLGKRAVLNDGQGPLPSSSVFLKKKNKLQVVGAPLDLSTYQLLKTGYPSGSSYQQSHVFQKDSSSPARHMSITQPPTSTCHISKSLLNPQNLSLEGNPQGLTNSSVLEVQSLDVNAARFEDLNFMTKFCSKEKTATPVSSDAVAEVDNNHAPQPSVLSPEDIDLFEPSLLHGKDNKPQKQPNSLENDVYGFFPLSPDNASDGEKCSILSVDESGEIVNANSLTDTGANDISWLAEDDQSWRSYIDNPITSEKNVTTKKINDNAPALGLLYDFYKVPKEKRILSCTSNVTQTLSSALQQQPLQVLSSVSFDVFSTTTPANVSYPSDSFSKQEPNELKRISYDGAHEMSLVTSNTQLNGELPTSAYLLSEPSQTLQDNTIILSSSNVYQGKEFITEAFSVADNTHVKYLPVQIDSTLPSQTSTCDVQSLLHLSAIPTTSLANGLPGLNSLQQETNQQHPVYAGELFEYTMEAPKSLKQKEGEAPMCYINKGQFYCISLRAINPDLLSNLKDSKISSTVQIVFKPSKPEEEQLRHWNYWHGRQHTAKQRIIDIADYKDSCMISEINEFAYNAINFTWSSDETAKIFITCNCLSTDFSPQKGVKGLPLLLQIDTYADKNRSTPLHRGYCQLKVFCDKGAERKIRDEERKTKKKRYKSGTERLSSSSLSTIDFSAANFDATSAKTGDPAPKKQDPIRFLTAEDPTIPVVYFRPDLSGNFRSLPASPTCRRVSTERSPMSGATTPTNSDIDMNVFAGQIEGFDSLRVTKRPSSVASPEEEELINNKLPRIYQPQADKKNVLLYIRKEADEVFDALMLKESTLDGLKEALEEKYEISSDKIVKLLQKSKKGILVNVDDMIVSHFNHEDTFVIDITSERSNDVRYVVTLFAVD